MESTESNRKMTTEKFKTTTRQKVKPATHHEKSMNSDQTTKQAIFMAVFMVLICLILQALFLVLW